MLFPLAVPYAVCLEYRKSVLKIGKAYYFYRNYQVCSATLILKEIMQVVFLYVMAHTRVKNGSINALLHRIGQPSNVTSP